MKYLSASTIVAINRLVAEEQAGVRDLGGVESVAHRPRPAFGVDYYDTAPLKAAVLLHGLATTQSFVNGNKRTAWAVADLMLKINGVHLRELPLADRKAFVIAVAVGEFTVLEIAEWFEAHRITATDRCGTFFVATDAAVDPDLAVASASNAFFSRMVVDELPSAQTVHVIAQIHWFPHDAHQRFHLIVRADGHVAQVLGPSPHWLQEQGLDDYISWADVVGPPSEVQSFVATPVNVGHNFPTPGHTDSMTPNLEHIPVVVELLTSGTFELTAWLGGELFASRRLAVETTS